MTEPASLADSLADIFDPGIQTTCTLYPALFDPPGRGEGGRNPDYVCARNLKAIAICERCEVLDECRRWALNRKDEGADVDDQIYGGMTGRQRRLARGGDGSKPHKRREYPAGLVDPDAVVGGCKRGHPPDDRYIRPNGDGRCKSCARENAQTARYKRLLRGAA